MRAGCNGGLGAAGDFTGELSLFQKKARNVRSTAVQLAESRAGKRKAGNTER